MANYSLVIDSKFKPFSFERYIQPYQIYGQAYRELEDVYGELDAQASIWDKRANESTDPKAHALYKRYADDLKAQAGALATEGLNPTSRQAMLNMRSRYAKEIVPIKEAYDRRKEQADEQRKAMLANPTLLLSRSASTTSLDDYLDNPNLSYQSYSGALLTQQVAQQASHLAKELRDYGNGKRLDSFTKTFLQQHGFTKDEVLEAINNPRNGSPVLRAIADSAIGASGITDKWENDALNLANYYANLGLWSAVGESSVSPYADKAAEYAAQLANQKKLAKYQQGLIAAQAEQDRIKMYDVDPTSYFSKDDIAKANNATAKELDKWREAGYFNSKGLLTHRGLKALKEEITSPSSGVTSSITMPKSGTIVADALNNARMPSSGVTQNLNILPIHLSTSSQFKDWANKHGVKTNDPMLVNKINRYYRDTRSAIARGELPTGTANFQVYRQTLGDDEKVTVAKKLMNLGKVYEVGELSNGSIQKGKGYTAEEFLKEIGDPKENILYTINSPTTGAYGQQMVELVDGRKFLIPESAGEQFFGTETYRNLQEVNRKIRGATSRAEVAVNANRANSYMAKPLTITSGTTIKPYDGTTFINLLENEEEEEE